LIPPLNTQRKIAGVLSAYDDLIENNSRRIAILEEMAQAIYREWFVNFRFPGHENVKLIDSPLGKIPEGWRVANLFDIAEISYGFPYKSKQFTTTPEGKPVIRIRDILGHRSETYTNEDAGTKYIVKDGDILIGMDGDFHMCRWAGGDAVLNQRVARLRTKNELPQYVLFHCVREPILHFNATIVGTTVAHLGDKHLREINVVCPPMNLLINLHAIFEPLFFAEINLRKKIELLRSTRDLLLPKLISGQLDVEDLDIDIGEQPVEATT
jgi:type I restriction enzyme S subunit